MIVETAGCNGLALFLGSHEDSWRAAIAQLEAKSFTTALWCRDGAAWQLEPAVREEIRGSLGWLVMPTVMAERTIELESFVSEVRADGLTHAVLMGMGGSSLAPLVFARSFPPAAERLCLHVLDTTDPVSILQLERSLPLACTLFITASKSGTTIEPNAFDAYFFARAMESLQQQPGSRFVAITDPGSPLVGHAEACRYRKVFVNFPDIGGRYSALSYFGLLPAALHGVRLQELLGRAQAMADACAPSVSTATNPGVALGAAMAALAQAGCDKLTLLLPDSLAVFGLWLEQLLAESTGKNGIGILPVVGEPLGEPTDYGNDRFFVLIRLAGSPDERCEHLAYALRDSGHPLAIIDLEDPYAIGAEFFRWEIATATAGNLLGINPFDQPNVQESKERTNALLATVVKQGSLPARRPAFVAEVLSFFGPPPAPSAAAVLSCFFATVRPRDYIALQAYLTETPAMNATLCALQGQLRAATGLAVTVGYGPRYLHSTGQYHKGGPNTGLFLQLTADDTEDVAIPGQGYTFGTLKRAQADGDMDALLERGRRVLRVHLGRDALHGIKLLRQLLAAVLNCPRGLTHQEDVHLQKGQ